MPCATTTVDTTKTEFPTSSCSNSGAFVFDRNLAANVDALRLILLDAASETLLPELYKVFGAKRLIEFLVRFAGTTFKVPSPEVLTSMFRDAEIYVRCNAGESHSSVAKDLLMNAPEVRAVYTRLRKLAEGLQK